MRQTMKRKKRPTTYQLERQRFRNTQRRILNLEERVKAIQLYDQSPIYMRVAMAFKCSWEQIKNVIQNRDAILEYYARCQTVGANDNPRMVRQKKINFLGKVMYEYVRRAHYYSADVIDNDTVRNKALIFRNILQIDCFSPNKAWVMDFKATYNLDFERLDSLVFTQKPPSSLNCLDIVIYCSKELADTQKTLHKENGVDTAEAIEFSAGSINDYSNVIDVGSEDSKDVEFDNIDPEDDFDDDIDVGGAEEDDFDADADSIVDGDDINENEEGPTIYYGDYDYHDDAEDDLNSDMEQNESFKNVQSTQNSRMEKETQLTSQANQMSAKTSLVPDNEHKNSTQEPLKSTNQSQKSSTNPQNASTNLQKLQNDSTEYIPNIKEVTSNAVISDTPTRKGKILDSSLIASLHDSLHKDNYAAALEILQPLEEFALMQENFPAINLLAQLCETFRKGRQRKI